MRTWYDAIKKGLQMLAHRDNYAYFYGAKGYLLTNERMEQLIALEPEYFKRYSKAEILQIKANSLNKIGYDCSGFTGECTGDKQYSFGQISNCIKYNTLTYGPAGSLLYTSFGGTGRHIGLDMGYGYCLDMGVESTDSNVAAGLDSVRIRKISEVGYWERSGQSRVIDYTNTFNV